MYVHMQPGWMVEWVERPSPILGDQEIQTSLVRTLVDSNQWLKNVYMSLPSQALGIIRIGERLVVTKWAIRSWCWRTGFPVGKHYKVTRRAYLHKLVPILIWPSCCQDVKLQHPTHLYMIHTGHSCTLIILYINSGPPRTSSFFNLFIKLLLWISDVKLLSACVQCALLHPFHTQWYDSCAAL